MLHALMENHVATPQMSNTELMSRVDKTKLQMQALLQVTSSVPTSVVGQPIKVSLPTVTSRSFPISITTPPDAHSILNQVGLTDDHLTFLKDAIMQRTSKPVSTLVLHYQASRDGFIGRDFHKYCDGISRMLIVIRTRSGFLFGGYSTVPYESSDMKTVCLVDDTSFLYTLVNPHNIAPKIFLPTTGGKSGLSCAPECGPRYGLQGGYTDLSLRGNCNINGGKSMFGLELSGYVDTTGLGPMVWAGGVKEEGVVTFEAVTEVLGFQV